MTKIFLSIKNLLQDIQKRTVLVAMTIALAIGYYINPLANVDLTEWNRTFSSAVLSGISIDTRIANFYKYFFLYLPTIFLVVLVSLVLLYKIRPKYADYFSKFGIFLALVTVSSFISKYTRDATLLNENSMIHCILVFLIVLAIVAVLDRNEKFIFKDIVIFFLFFLISVTAMDMIFHADKQTYILIAAAIIIGLAAGNIYLTIGGKVGSSVQLFLCFLLWIPAIIRAELEGIYFLTEKGYQIERYFTHIMRTTILVILFMGILTFLLRKKKWSFEKIGYIGAIVSFSSISYLQYAYQYVFSYGSMSSLYELGNGAVAMDTYLYGKLPIIDYFSAHALHDVWTKLLYSFMHNDINGILVDPYGGLKNIIAFIILFYIIKQIMNAEIAVLFVLLFPGLLTGIKWTSVCCASIAMLIYICRKPSVRNYVMFWIVVLIGAFMIYDEGVALGIAAILAYMVFHILQKNWNELKKFILSGVAVGGVALVFYIVYALKMGIPVVGRIKEWISLSAGSSSSWATSNFGDQTSFAFLVSYFVVPITAIILMIVVLVRYIKTKKYLNLTILTIAFALAEILYITRTIVFHNLAVCSGWTGVLLNFIHWTVAIYVLYVTSEKELSENIRLLSFTGAMLVVILFEGTAVTKYWPTANSSLLNKGLKAVESWDLQDDVSYNNGQSRIVYDNSTNMLVSSFTKVFDTLLTEEQTFLDFANVTSLYLMTGRVRPCYVGQSPSLLTDLYSQECFFDEISKYDCPLAVVGTTETSYLQQMIGVPHNVRYYKVAEYVYNNYRPLVNFGEFSIWCEKELWNEYHSFLETQRFEEKGYALVDYGYDFTTSNVDENGNMQLSFAPYHSFDLSDIPYIWANYDDYNAIDNSVITEIEPAQENRYEFAGSQSVLSPEGNYIAFEATNNTDEDISINIVLYDSASENEGAKIRYYFVVKPGTNQYLIRASEDYFWDVFNVDTILFGSKESISIQNVRILEGD